jgi:hypothetical protein
MDNQPSNYKPLFPQLTTIENKNISSYLKDMASKIPEVELARIITLTQMAIDIKPVRDFILENNSKWFDSPYNKLQASLAPFEAPDENFIDFINNDFSAWFSLTETQMKEIPSTMEERYFKLFINDLNKANKVNEVSFPQVVMTSIAYKNTELTNWIDTNQENWKSLSAPKMLAYVKAFDKGNGVENFIKKNIRNVENFTLEQLEETTKAFDNQELGEFATNKLMIWKKFSVIEMQITNNAFKNNLLASWIEEYTVFWVRMSKDKKESTIQAFDNKKLAEWIKDKPAFWSNFNDEQVNKSIKAFEIPELADWIKENKTAWASFSSKDMDEKIVVYKPEATLKKKNSLISSFAFCCPGIFKGSAPKNSTNLKDNNHKNSTDLEGNILKIK